MRKMISTVTAVLAVLLTAQPLRNASGLDNFEHVHALTMDAEGRSLFLGAHAGLFRSDDGGRSWQRLPLPANRAHIDVMAVTPHPEDARILYVGTHEAGVLKTTDGGKTWLAANNGLAGLDVHGLAIDPREPQKLHAAIRDTGEGIYRSSDGGGRWVRVDDGPGGEVKVLTSVNIPTGMGGIFLYAGTAAGLQRNPDCFWGWKTVGGLPTSTVNGFAVHPSNPKLMYVAMRDGVLRSDNAGQTWTRAANGVKNVAAVAVHPKNPTEVYAVTMDGALFRSTDAGGRWTELRDESSRSSKPRSGTSPDFPLTR